MTGNCSSTSRNCDSLPACLKGRFLTEREKAADRSQPPNPADQSRGTNWSTLYLWMRRRRRSCSGLPERCYFPPNLSSGANRSGRLGVWRPQRKHISRDTTACRLSRLPIRSRARRWVASDHLPLWGGLRRAVLSSRARPCRAAGAHAGVRLGLATRSVGILVAYKKVPTVPVLYTTDFFDVRQVAIAQAAKGRIQK